MTKGGIMNNSIQKEIEKRINGAEDDAIFLTQDFNDLASLATVRKCLSRLANENKIHRITNGMYYKLKYSEFLQEYIPPSINNIVECIARKNHWTISYGGNRCLNGLGLSTQVPSKIVIISDGPDKIYNIMGLTITFQHRPSKCLTNLSSITKIIIETLHTLGRNYIDNDTINILKSRIPPELKNTLLIESKGTSEWIYSYIRKVCKEKNENDRKSNTTRKS